MITMRHSLALGIGAFLSTVAAIVASNPQGLGIIA